MKLVKVIVVDEIPKADNSLIEREKLVNVLVIGGLSSFMTHNITGNLANFSFTLNAAYDWTLGTTEDGRVVLIPLRK